jgi:hypothetical protein
VLAPRRSKIITSGNIDKATCPFEEFIKNDFNMIFPWIGRFILEEKTKPIIFFKGQEEFESVKQSRVYRLWNKGNPTKCCIRFTYDTANKEFMASWSKESREYMTREGTRVHTIPKHILAEQQKYKEQINAAEHS